jgi:hypothetical protein
MYVSGNVMIGRSGEPFYTLDVSSASTQPFRVGVGSTNAIVVDNNGLVGVGRTNPSTTLDVSGVIYTNNITKTTRVNQNFNSNINAWFLLGRYDSTANINNGASFILEIAGGGGYDGVQVPTFNFSGGKTTIYGRILNNNNSVVANLSLSYKFEGSSTAAIKNVIGVQVGSNRNQYDIYVLCEPFSQCILNVDTVTLGSLFSVNSTINSTVTAPSTTASSTVAVGKLLISMNNGAVGIGTTTPSYPLHVNGTGGDVSVLSYFEAYNGLRYGSTSVNVSIYASGFIAGVGVGAHSDKRIKKNIIDIEDAVALEILNKLKPKSYNYIDLVNRGDKLDWGFIAQDVKEIFPSSVIISKDFIPNIYELGTVSTDGTIVTLTDKFTSDINIEISPLIIKFYDISNNVIEKEIVQIIDEKNFKLKTSIEKNNVHENQIFIYGQSVDDFHSVSKDAILTITTASVQQIYRELTDAKQNIHSQEAEIQDLKSQIQTIMERLTAANNP